MLSSARMVAGASQASQKYFELCNVGSSGASSGSAGNSVKIQNKILIGD